MNQFYESELPEIREGDKGEETKIEKEGKSELQKRHLKKDPEEKAKEVRVFGDRCRNCGRVLWRKQRTTRRAARRTMKLKY